MSKKVSSPAAVRADIYETVTGTIVAALEQAASPTEWPWIKSAAQGVPLNARTRKPYNGVNRLLLGIAAMAGASRYWASFNQRRELGATVRNFVAVVARNRRLFALKSMADAFLADLARRRGEVRAEVVSARPLSDAQHQALLETLRRATGGKIAIDTAVDGSLIGGLVVRVGSRQIDTSLKTKLLRLQLAMKGAS